MLIRAPVVKEKRVRFEVAAQPGSRVYVAGTFNHWDPTATPMKRDAGSGRFQTALRVPAGTHEYRFVVDGVWSSDPKCTDWVANDCGSLNSVLHV